LEVVKNGFDNLTSDWIVEMRQGKKILAVVPAQGTFSLVSSNRRMQITRSYRGIVLKTGSIDNFILRNKKLDDVWLKGDVGTQEFPAGAEMIFDGVGVQKGTHVWIDTFTIWF
jgi:pectate lyase